jgi:hypothetical protein
MRNHRTKRPYLPAASAATSPPTNATGITPQGRFHPRRATCSPDCCHDALCRVRASRLAHTPDRGTQPRPKRNNPSGSCTGMAVPREPTCLPKRMKKRRNQASVRHQTTTTSTSRETQQRRSPFAQPRLALKEMPYEYKTLGLHGRSILHKVVPKPV